MEGKKRFHLPTRRYTQLLASVLYNSNFKGFFTGKIFRGNIKGTCLPGLNCYSCPGAIGACPLGSLQSGLVNVSYKFPFYVLGTLLLFGLFMGRFICGFLCPFGLAQELLSKIPVPKLKKSKVTKALSYLKYVILIGLAILIPIVKGVPGFCKYICPAGTAEGGFLLAITNESVRQMLGLLFSWKVFVFCSIIITCMFVHRAFCRFICPLGAIYSFFNPVAFFGIKVNKEKCIGCDACVKACKMDVKKVCDMECVHCGDCIKHCPTGAIGYGFWNKPFTKRKEEK